MKKIGYFLLVILCVLGCAGGIGYALYNGAWHIAIGVAVLSYTAWPKFREYIIALTL